MNELDDSTYRKISTLAAVKMPARIDPPAVAKLLGFALHDIPTLVSAGLLKPLGNPAPNATKWFATVGVLNLATDQAWLDRATKRIAQYWGTKRARRKGSQGKLLPLPVGLVEDVG